MGPQVLNLKFKGNKSFVSFSNLNETDALTKTWKVFTKVASYLEQGQRLENLSWRLWHLQSLMSDIDTSKSKLKSKKLSKVMGEKSNPTSTKHLPSQSDPSMTIGPDVTHHGDRNEENHMKPNAITWLERILNKSRKIGTDDQFKWMAESNHHPPRTTAHYSNITVNIDNSSHINSGNTTYNATNSHNTSSVTDCSNGTTNYTNTGAGTLNNASGSATIHYGNPSTEPSPPHWVQYHYSWLPCFRWDGWMSLFCGWMPCFWSCL